MNEYEISTAISRLETIPMPYGAEKEIEELKKSYEQKINDLTRKLNEKRK